MKLFILITIISISSFSAYAFNTSKIIECTGILKGTSFTNKYFKYEKKLLSKPSLKVRKNGVWEPYCTKGKLVFNEDSVACKSRSYNSRLDFISKEYEWYNRSTYKTTTTTKSDATKFKPIRIYKFNCSYDGKL